MHNHQLTFDLNINTLSSLEIIKDIISNIEKEKLRNPSKQDILEIIIKNTIEGDIREFLIGLYNEETNLQQNYYSIEKLISLYNTDSSRFFDNFLSKYSNFRNPFERIFYSIILQYNKFEFDDYADTKISTLTEDQIWFDLKDDIKEMNIDKENKEIIKIIFDMIIINNADGKEDRNTIIKRLNRLPDNIISKIIHSDDYSWEDLWKYIIKKEKKLSFLEGNINNIFKKKYSKEIEKTIK